MDLARFISILEDQALYFAAAASMPDKWEGAYGLNFDRTREFTRISEGTEINESMYLSCWFMSEYESAAIWDIYQREGRGVAIRTTWGRLKQSLDTKQPIFGGLVEYVDYSTVTFDYGNILSPYYNFKRKSFEHEQEVRLVHWSMVEPEREDDDIDVDVDVDEKRQGRLLILEDIVKPGFKFPVDVAELMPSIYIAPDAPDWIKNLVEQIVARYGLTIEVVQSDLNNGPIY